jgi:putative salt-induced outer membrane protein
MKLTACALALFLAAFALPAAAQTTDEDKPTQLTADFSFIQTDGNSEVMTLSGSDKLAHRTGNWVLIQEGIAVWGETDGVESAGRYGFRLRADRALSDRLSAYGLAEWNRNTFSGISRQFDEGIGLVWKAVITKPHTLDLEAGAGLAQRRPTTGIEDEFATGRAGLDYTYEFTEKSRLTARGAYLVNLEDTEDGQGEARVSMVAPVAGNFALKVTYDLLYRNKPQPGFETTDTTFGAGVQATF